MRCPIIFLNPPVTNVAVSPTPSALVFSHHFCNQNRVTPSLALISARQVLSTRDSGDAELLEAASAGLCAVFPLLFQPCVEF